MNLEKGKIVANGYSLYRIDNPPYHQQLGHFIGNEIQQRTNQPHIVFIATAPSATLTFVNHLVMIMHTHKHLV